jgi:RNA polymerase sigma-70 factor (ECF subfamily)
MPSGSPSEEGASGPASFLTTRWSLVVAAGRPGEPRARAALAELCEAYWRPVYAYVRRRGHASEDARDLTQAFFARLLERNAVQGADRDRGRFRGWLLGAVKHFLANEWDRAHALKRGGGVAPLSLDFETADQRLGLEPAHDLTPERAFEREWALAVLERAFQGLQEEWSARGRGELFAGLKDSLVGGVSDGYRALGERLGLSEGAVKVAAHRLRRAFREALRAEIAETVEGEAELEAELAHLIEALGTPPA